ncbi:matrilin-2-like [Aplochiton taeniatus]
MSSLVLSLVSLLCCEAALLDRGLPMATALDGLDQLEAQNNSVEGACKVTPLDFVFVIDSSRSIRPKDYEKVKAFIANLVRFLKVGPAGTRVALLQYGSVVHSEFSLRTHTTNAQVERAVGDMEHLATGTMTGLALRFVMETAFTEEEGARPLWMRVPRVVMVVTDGRPQDAVEEVAEEARQAGIQIFAVGVGRVDMNTLKAIGSKPHSEHVHLVANFSQIQSLTTVFQSKFCGTRDMCELTDHQCQHICISTPASYMCHCREGFTLNPDGKTCQANDICASVEHGCAHTCANMADGYQCVCRTGYELNNDLKTCRRIDYCDLGKHGCQHDCVSTAESYVCRCKEGYVLNMDQKTCNQNDHCALGDHGCEHECLNTMDSFVCKCRAGYTLQPDGKTCRGIGYCAFGNPRCEHECVNTKDSFVCKCREGYTLRPDAKTCESLDLCQTLDHGCEHQCVSSADAHVCKCYEGFTLAEDGKRCKKHDCGDGAMDLVFVIDGSKSLGAANFELVKQFVNSMVDSLDVSSRGTHVGLLQYSTKVRAEFTLGHFTSAKEVKRAVSAMRYMGRGSMTGSALQHVFEHSFSAREGARPGVPRVSVVFTDGRSQDDVSGWATKTKDAGVTMYALGIGKAIEEELRQIASEPKEKHLHYAQDFSQMGEITNKLMSRICEVKPSDETLCNCENVVLFQTTVAEKLRQLTQNNILYCGTCHCISMTFDL